MLTKQVGCARAQALLKGSSTRIRQLAGICSLLKATEDHTLNPKPLAVYIAEGAASLRLKPRYVNPRAGPLRIRSCYGILGFRV